MGECTLFQVAVRVGVEAVVVKWAKTQASFLAVHVVPQWS